jgi:hypothetical protein
VTPVRGHLSVGPDVVGPAEARELLGGISRQRMHQLERHQEFPPHTELEIGRVWHRVDVIAFQQARLEPRRRLIVRALTTYRATGVIAEAARAAGVRPYTVRRWFRELGVPLPRDT